MTHSVDPHEPRDWVFTFGIGHVHPITGESLANRYVIIHGDSETARAKMIERFGQKWSHQYPDLETARVADWKMTQLEIT